MIRAPELTKYRSLDIRAMAGFNVSTVTATVERSLKRPARLLVPPEEPPTLAVLVDVVPLTQYVSDVHFVPFFVVVAT
jgi:hypothetical protein